MKKIREDKPVGVLIHTYMEISQGNSQLPLSQAKMSCSSFSLFSPKNLDTRKAEQVLPRGEGWHQWEGEVLEKRVGG
jgi:hypothetical protein